MKIGSVFSRFWTIAADFDLSPSEIALFFAILSEINKARTTAKNGDLLEVEVEIRVRHLEILTGLSKMQILRLRNRLAQLGFIEFKKGTTKKHFAKYKLGKLFRAESDTENDTVQAQINSAFSSDHRTLNVTENVTETRNRIMDDTENVTENVTENDTENDTHIKEIRELRDKRAESINSDFSASYEAEKSHQNPRSDFD